MTNNAAIDGLTTSQPRARRRWRPVQALVGAAFLLTACITGELGPDAGASDGGGGSHQVSSSQSGSGGEGGAGTGTGAAGGGGEGGAGGGGIDIPTDPTKEPTFTLDCAANRVLVHPMFTDHMVLQRSFKTPVWGCTDPGRTVTVEIAGQTVSGTANAAGLWYARLNPMDAGGPYTMSISDGISAPITLSDVLVGDVWLCSGQSNMQWGMHLTTDGQAEVANASSFTKLRLFNVPFVAGAVRPAGVFSAPTRWDVTSPDSARYFSAVCYLTGRELTQRLDIPIGLIASSVGGTAAELWVSDEGLSTLPDFAAQLNDLRTGNNPPQLNLYVTSLYNSMISPIVPYALRGAIWYQGESNVGRGEQYRRLLPALISDWRDKFCVGDFPFLITEITNFVYNGTAAEVREAQFLTTRKLPHVGLAVAIDTGLTADIHPPNKQDVAERLALLARGFVYGEDVPYMGPVYKSMTIEGNRIRLTFDNVNSGLMVSQKVPLQPVVAIPGGRLASFTIAGAGDDPNRFVPADAVIDGDTVVVSSPQVPSPTVVRYDWADDPLRPSLYNHDGLPAVPFRTDAPAP